MKPWIDNLHEKAIVNHPENYNPNRIYVSGTEINLEHQALEIYLSGCKGHECVGCHNPELWAFDIGRPWECVKDEVLKKAVEGSTAGLLKYIWILGGEPLDQHGNRMQELMKDLRETGLKLVLWTHYLPEEDDGKVPFCYGVDYIKMGPYVAGGEEYIEPVLGIKLANREQYVIEVPEEWKRKDIDPIPVYVPRQSVLQILSYISDQKSWLQEHPVSERTKAYMDENLRRYCKLGALYIPLLGKVWKIAPHPDLDDTVLSLCDRDETNYVLTHLIPYAVREDFLKGNLYRVTQVIDKITRKRRGDDS